jgi:hypothetical protein
LIARGRTSGESPGSAWPKKAIASPPALVKFPIAFPEESEKLALQAQAPENLRSARNSLFVNGSKQLKTPSIRYRLMGRTPTPHAMRAGAECTTLFFCMQKLLTMDDVFTALPLTLNLPLITSGGPSTAEGRPRKSSRLCTEVPDDGLGRRDGLSIMAAVTRGHRVVLRTSVVVNHMPSLGRLQHTQPEAGEAGLAIVLRFHELQAVDLTFGNAVAPCQREPRGDRDRIIFQSPRQAGELVDAAVRGPVILASRSCPRRSRTMARKAWSNSLARATSASIQ